MFDPSTSVLIIEDSHTVRQSLRTMLGNVGITRSETAVNAADGLQRIRKKVFDIVLCDYNLGEGMNGQELLELLRREGGYPLTSVWIMITGERKYERVVAAAEVAPDDYILKPFSSQTLLDRLELSHKRKLFLRPAHLKLSVGDVAGAITVLKQLETIAENNVQLMDVLRLMAETYLANDQFRDARAVYEKILSMRAIPWAKMGMVRILREQDEVSQSTDLLNEIISEAPSYTDAYDALAHNLSHCGQFAEALSVLEKAVALSPRNFLRLCSCGEVALSVGDPAKAAGYLEKAVLIGRNNSAFGPGVMVDLLQAYSESEQLDKMDRLSKELAGMLKSDSDQFLALTCRALSALARKNFSEAQELLKQALQRLLAVPAPWRDVTRFVEAAVRLQVEQGEHPAIEWFEQLSLRFVKNHLDVEQLSALCRESESLADVIEQAYSRLQTSNDKAMELVKNGQKQQATLMLFDAAMETHNDRLGMNACALLLMSKEEGVLDKAKQLLDWLPPEHERVRGFRAELSKREVLSG